jgi:methyltransferase (TIGR00027 family)
MGQSLLWLGRRGGRTGQLSRADDDTWDLSESVGATALGTAESRAKETNRQPRLFTDPYAQLFLDAAVARGVSYSLFTDEMITRVSEVDPLMEGALYAQWAYTASRTKWFDDFFTDAAAAGIRQAVILGAGLDSRAWRLPWAKESAVFEIDQPKVLQFKAETLRTHGAEPACRYVAVGVDLRHDWPKALCDNSFDPEQPTAWAAEGLLAYLASDAQDRLFDQIQVLSAAGSRLAADVFGAAFFDPENLAKLGAWFRRFREAVLQAGGQIGDTPSLWIEENRTDVADWLRDHNWQVEMVEVHDLMASYHREVPGEEAVGIPECEFVTGQLMRT